MTEMIVAMPRVLYVARLENQEKFRKCWVRNQKIGRWCRTSAGLPPSPKYRGRMVYRFVSLRAVQLAWERDHRRMKDDPVPIWARCGVARRIANVRANRL